MSNLKNVFNSWEQISNAHMNNSIFNNRHIAGVILAAGKGTRMNLEERNKVTLHLAEKPIVLHIVEFMKTLPIDDIVVVVGHAKETVMQVLEKEQVIFAEQQQQLGTGDALAVAFRSLPPNITDAFVVYGDDAVFYNSKHKPIIEQLFIKHIISNAAITFLTIERENPTGLGRIIRDAEGHVQAIVEEKDATAVQKAITEINPGSFIFKVSFLKKYLPLIKKSPVTGEYYLTSLIDIAVAHNELVETLKGGKLLWRGVNTPEELEEAKVLYSKIER